MGMIKIGQVVEIASCEKTEIFCGRRSQYKIGDQFVVKNIGDNPRGYGKILSDGDYNFIHEDDVKYEFEVSNDHWTKHAWCVDSKSSLQL